MPETFETKIRKVGTSFGVLIPNEVIETQHLKEGEKVRIGVLKERKIDEVLKAFGSVKGAKPFERDKTNRF